ncbi:MAG: hypothetical protein PHE84_10395 [bacterium]|nr:hypothetical protein [bacterium]
MSNFAKSVFPIGLGILFFVGCATIHRMDIAKLNVISVSEIVADPAKMLDYAKIIQEGKDIVFKIPEGQAIPLKLNLDLPVAKLEPGKNQVVFSRDVYLWISKSRARVSPDGQRWADIGNLKSIGKLFGFGKGQVSLGFFATKEEGAAVSVDIKTD